MPAQKWSRNTLQQALWSRIEEHGDFPALAESVRYIVSVMEDDQAPIEKLEAAVVSDVPLAHQVIRRVNSVSYAAYGRKITSIARAIMILGCQTIGYLALDIKLVESFAQTSGMSAALTRELLRAELASTIAHGIALSSKAKEGGKAALCALLQHTGRLLVACYFPEEWAVLENVPEARMESECLAVLGVSLETLGLDAARRWGFPEQLLEGMRIHAPRPLPEKISSEQRVGAITAFSSRISAALLTQAPADESKALIAQYAGPLGLAPEAMEALVAESFARMVNSKYSSRALETMLEAPDRAEAAAQARVAECGRNGIDRMTALPPGASITEVFQVALQALTEGLEVTAAVAFIRNTQAGCIEAKLCFGERPLCDLSGLRCGGGAELDIFQLSMSKALGMFIQDLGDVNISRKIPVWHRQAYPQATASFLLPVLVHGKAAALLYGVWSGTGPARGMTDASITALSAFAEVLGQRIEQVALAGGG